jgi:hypothetical protein
VLRCLFDPWIRDPGWVKNQDPDHISESLETIFRIKLLKFFDAVPDPGWKNLGSGINNPVRKTVNDSSILDAGADGECCHVRPAAPPAAATGPVHQAVPLPVPTRGFRYLATIPGF